MALLEPTIGSDPDATGSIGLLRCWTVQAPRIVGGIQADFLDFKRNLNQPCKENVARPIESL